MPCKPGQREYRTLGSFHVAERGDDGRNAYVVEGYATTFDEPYEYGGSGEWYERVDRSALDGADMSDVIFQLNHEGPVMARMRNGTLLVEPDEHGLHVRADLSGSKYGRDLYEAIANGLIDRMSWGFSTPVGDDSWDYDRDTHTFTLKRVAKVFDVSAVSLPADEDTEIHARSSYLDGAIERERRESALRADMERRRRAAAALGLLTIEQEEA